MAQLPRLMAKDEPNPLFRAALNARAAVNEFSIGVVKSAGTMVSGTVKLGFNGLQLLNPWE